MARHLGLKAYKEIRKVLLDRRFIRMYGFRRERIASYLNEVSFLDALNAFFDNQDFSCQGTLKLFESLLNEMAGDKRPEEWLPYIYQYALYQSFPSAVTIVLDPALNPPVILYLEVLKIVLEYQKASKDQSFQSQYPFYFLMDKEIEGLEDPREYKRFMRYFKNDYVYEMMKLNLEVTGHATIDHICGVHYLAMRLGRQLKQLGAPVDLGRISGAAAGHDIGKFGCKPSELRKVAYYHYYYTDEWFIERNIAYIRNIAVNHSTWDLELENLSVESLILIYSDFCVKRVRDKSHPYSMKFFNMTEAFQVILDKLDNVDAAKEKRYRRVYAKLKDFEDYMVDMGVELDVHADVPDHKPYEDQKLYALMYGDDIIQHFKYQAIAHNIELMYVFRDEDSLNTILDNARSERDLNHFRRYVYVLEEYFTYMTPKQKLITLDFLYESLIHPEEDLRKQCAELMGKILATFDEPYRKELPEGAVVKSMDVSEMDLIKQYLEMFLYPDTTYTEKKTLWIGYSLRFMLKALFSRTHPDQTRDIIHILKGFFMQKSDDSLTQQFLLGIVKIMPFNICELSVVNLLFDFIHDHSHSENIEIRMSAYEALLNILSKLPDEVVSRINVKELLSLEEYEELGSAEAYARTKVAEVLQVSDKKIKAYRRFWSGMYQDSSELYLSNLKTATPSVVKRLQIELLTRNALNGHNDDIFYTAMHFCNLLKVSAYESVRNHAGKALIEISDVLTAEQINDITIELLRALEIEGYQFTKLIPEYLGQLFIRLDPHEFDEIIDDLGEKIKKSSPYLRALLLKTAGVIAVHYILKHDDEAFEHARMSRVIGILFNGLVNEKELTNQIAFSVIGKDIFGNEGLSFKQKRDLFNLIAKKLLAMITEIDEHKELDFLNYSAGLNYIYRFISDYTHFVGDIEMCIPRKVAYYSGTFDPFSWGQKMVARKIRDMGYDVYIAIDEFTWNRRTQPNLLRRKIIDMSISDELSIFTFPKAIPVNLENDKTLEQLKTSFDGMEVHIIAGEDSLINNDAYWQSDNGIFEMPHIIFEREVRTKEKHEQIHEHYGWFKAPVQKEQLPRRFENISSRQIRRNIDKGWDISDLIDPLAQSFVHEKNMYKNEPQFKEIATVKSVKVGANDAISEALIQEILKDTPIQEGRLRKIVEQWHPVNYGRILVMRDEEKQGRITGFSLFRCFGIDNAKEVLGSERLANEVRQFNMDKLVLVDGIYAEKGEQMHRLEQLVLTETLTHCIAQGYQYSIFANQLTSKVGHRLKRSLELMGFIKVSDSNFKQDVYMVRMDEPCALILDAQSMMKSYFRRNEEIRRAIVNARERLQNAITKIYPGNLLLMFDRGIMYEHLISIITKTNGVTVDTADDRHYGPYMCVPYGDIFKRWMLPNTVTKAFHTERCYEDDLVRYNILAYPNYLSIPNQTRTIWAFNRPLILVDDLLDRGLRVQNLQKYFETQDIEIKKLVVAIMSKRGKERLEEQGIEVESAYFIPKLKVWFNESHVYPFMGGDSFWRNEYPNSNLLPTINLILPYVYPKFIKNASKRSIYNFSKVCLENAIEILGAIERVYLKEYHRNLTLSHLGEVFIVPRIPEKGQHMEYDHNYKPTDFLKNDLEMLKRMEKMLF